MYKLLSYLICSDEKVVHPSTLEPEFFSILTESGKKIFSEQNLESGELHARVELISFLVSTTGGKDNEAVLLKKLLHCDLMGFFSKILKKAVPSDNVSI